MSGGGMATFITPMLPYAKLIANTQIDEIGWREPSLPLNSLNLNPMLSPFQLSHRYYPYELT